MEHTKNELSWLYFSDFHFGRGQGGQGSAMASLVDYVSKELNRSPKGVDAIFLAGDIAYSGIAEEYKLFEDNFLNPMRKLDIARNATVFAVPGNHDLDCDAGIPISWTSIGKRNQPIYFLESDKGHEVRSARSKAFSEYSDFISRNNIVGPDPLKEVSLLSIRDDFPVDILTINTSWFCDREHNSEEAILPCPLDSMRHHFQSRETPRTTVILGHHPIWCFLKEHQIPFETVLQESHAVYLHGHEHDPKATFKYDGTIRTLGFGASYLAPLESVATAPYLNSFASGRIDTKLHLTGYSWNFRLGCWENSTRTQFHNCGMPHESKEQALSFNLPLLTRGVEKPLATPALSTIARKSPEPYLITSISEPSDTTWELFLQFSKSHRKHEGGSAARELLSDGKVEYILEQDGKRDLFVCIPGHSHILSSTEIESYNTRLDTEDLYSVTILSLGKISNDANNMYTRLKARKPIEVLVNQDIVAHWRQLVSSGQAKIISSYDAGNTTARIVICDESVFLVAVNGGDQSNFHVLGTEGTPLPSSHQVVRTLRDSIPAFATLNYTDTPFNRSTPGGEHQFDEQAYLEQCHKEYNAIRYAALASMGIRASDMSLESIYVDASACEKSDTQMTKVDEMLDDHLSAFPTTDEMKEQLKQQLRASLNVQDHRETSRAGEFCQKYGAVLLTGDPGSGKTCFVKAEILSYARRAMQSDPSNVEETNSWHSGHVPILISLSQVAAENDLKEKGILYIASRLLARRGDRKSVV